MGTQRGVERDVTRFLENADEVARFKDRLQYCSAAAGIGAQIAVAQIGRGEKRRSASQIENDIAVGPRVVARRPEHQRGARGWRSLREIVDCELERAEMAPGISYLPFRHWKIGHSRWNDRRPRLR